MLKQPQIKKNNQNHETLLGDPLNTIKLQLRETIKSDQIYDQKIGTTQTTETIEKNSNKPETTSEAKEESKNAGINANHN